MTTQPRRTGSARRLAKFFSAFLVLILSLHSPLRAQAQTASLEVQLRDASGAVVPGATLKLTNVDTNQSVTLTTDEEGRARASELAPGLYTMTVEARGFRKLVRQDVQVGVNKSQSLDIELEAGATVEEVTVASAGGDEWQRELSALPNLNNDLTPLLQIVPGAVAVAPSTLGKVVIDGKGKDQQSVRLDGADVTTLVALPSGDSALDVLSSFQKPEVAFDIDNSRPTQSRAFAPKFGPGTGSVVDGISYRGLGDWREQFYVSHRNDALNARNYFDYDGKNALRRTRFGAQAGGPLGHNTFVYLGYDGVRGRIERNLYEAVPTDAACNCASGPLAPLMRGFLPSGTSVLSGTSLNTDFLAARRRARVGRVEHLGRST